MTPRRIRLGVDIFTGLVIASVGLALAGLTWRLQGYPGTGPVAAPVVAGAGPQADVRPLLALAPFGAAMAAPTEGGDGTIRLRAIFLAMLPEASVALIAGADGKVASYGIGQAVGGGIIETIEAEQIVLRTPGGQRAIGFNPDGAGVSSAPALASGAAASTGAAPPNAAPSAPRQSTVPATGADAVRALIPPSAQGRSAPTAVPPQASNGFRVGASPSGALVAAGIRPGDVVERVNGSAVSGGSERDLIARAVAAGSAKVDVVRDGQRISLTLRVR